MATARQTTLIVGAGMGIFAATAGLTTVMLNAQPSLLGILLPTAGKPRTVCKTIATDPKPPLNVRSSPVVAADNVIGKLKNGTQLTVVDENEGWLRIAQPQEGWVYKELTVTSCAPAAAPKSTSGDEGEATLAEAREFYHAGNLKAAIALAQTVNPTSAAYQTAQMALLQWQQDWTRAEADFYAAQSAYREQRWQDVLRTVKRYPDNRFWRNKLAPLVQDAIKRQGNA